MSNTVHAVVRTDAMSATNGSAGLYSVKFYEGSTATAIDNGNVLALDSLTAGNREIWKAVKPAADTAISKIVLVATPEVMYDERLRNLTDFYNEADGEPARGYALSTGDMFSVTDKAIDGTAEVGSIVELQASTKLKVVKTATAGATRVGTVIAVEIVGTLTYCVIRVD